MLNEVKWNRIYLALGYTDLRLGIDGLAAKIQNEFSISPFQQGNLFLFCGRKPDRLKGLVWCGDGFLLLYKRQEAGKFRWPRSSAEAEEITPQQLRWLLDGLSVYQKTEIKEIKPRNIL